MQAVAVYIGCFDTVEFEEIFIQFLSHALGQVVTNVRSLVLCVSVSLRGDRRDLISSTAAHADKVAAIPSDGLPVPRPHLATLKFIVGAAWH